jgi:hypothetical protein
VTRTFDIRIEGPQRGRALSRSFRETEKTIILEEHCDGTSQPMSVLRMAVLDFFHDRPP